MDSLFHALKSVVLNSMQPTPKLNFQIELKLMQNL